MANDCAMTDPADEHMRKLGQTTGIPLAPVRDFACSTCPFRLCNADSPTKHTAPGVMTAVWNGVTVGDTTAPGVRDGQRMYCHAGTPTMTRKWIRAVPEYRPCVGALVVQQREALRYHRTGTINPVGLGAEALQAVVRRMFGRELSLSLFGVLNRRALAGATHPAINDASIGHPDIDPPRPGEFE